MSKYRKNPLHWHLARCSWPSSWIRIRIKIFVWIRIQIHTKNADTQHFFLGLEVSFESVLWQQQQFSKIVLPYQNVSNEKPLVNL